MRVGPFEIDETAPKLKNTRAIAMLRPWIDVGQVGTLVLAKLEDHLGAKDLAKLAKPGSFFDFTTNRPYSNIIDGRRTLTIPNSIVRYAKDEENELDYIFLHLREPNANGEDYTDAIVDLLHHFNVTQYCRIGSMYDNVPHTRPLLVTGSLSDVYSERLKGLVSLKDSMYQGPTTIVNLVTETLADTGLELNSLMVHIPQYLQLDDDHAGAARILEVLCAMYGFPSSLTDLGMGNQQYEYISKAIEANDQVKRYVQRLETEYDMNEGGSHLQELTVLSPEVESFLRDVGKRLDGH